MPIGARTVGAGGYGKITLPEPYNKDAHSTVAEPCTTRKPGPAEALKLGIKLPWEGKVEQQDRKLLTKELFMDLEAYGLTRDEIRKLFLHLSIGDFYDRIKAMGIPKAQPGGPRKAARAQNMEHPKREAPIKPIDLKTYYDTEAGRKKAAAMGIPELLDGVTDEALDAELAQIDAELAELTRPVSETPHTPTPEELQDIFPEEKTKPVQARKFDDGKPPLSLLPATALTNIAQIMAYGAEKYGRNNWQKGLEWTRLLDAALRHLYAFASGQDADEESGLPHVAHAGCNILFLLDMIQKRPDLDDRS